MPVGVVRARCFFDDAIDDVAPVKLAAALRGALRQAIARDACPHQPPCAAFSCDADPSIALLLDPTSPAQRRTFAPAISARIEAIVRNTIDVEVLLWGARAVGAQALVTRALQIAGACGVFVDDVARAFRVGPLHVSVAPLALQAVALAGQREVLIELRNVMGTQGDFACLVADAAHDLVQYQLFDDGQATALGKAGCDQRADAARAHVKSLFAAVDVVGGAALPVHHGRKRSRRTGHSFALDGLDGHLVLRGELTALGPWLGACALRGVGLHKGFGLGQLRVWQRGLTTSEMRNTPMHDVAPGPPNPCWHLGGGEA